MSNTIEQTSTQELTETIDWTKDEDAMTWVDVSIQNRCLKKTELSELCSGIDGKKRTPETWRQYYYDKRLLGFDEYWLSQYRTHFRNKVGAKIYGKMDELISKEKDLTKLVTVGEFIEGKKPTTAVQVNTFNGDKYLEEV